MLIELNKNKIENLTKTELEIVKYINNNEDRMSEMSIVDIAFDTFSSPSTVSRAVRKCGINGFNELRYLSSKQADKQEISNMADVMNKSLVEAQRVIDRISVASVLEIIEGINQSSRITVIARGLTEYVGEEFSLKLQLLGYNSVFIRDPNIMRLKSRQLSEDETLLIFSLNGKTAELVESAENASVCGAQVITFCCGENSPLLELSDHSIVGYRDANDSIKEYEVASRVSLQMIARILIDYIALYD
ncbi:MAG: MurR/RpiR family transcriptional regulator [Eubacterium sp.]|nr:MurR/RpiR family transcriptional regulator [Eubacterium sp.]